MSTPILDRSDVLLGAMSELISAQSSLNMLPEPIQGSTGYISQTDANVKHAMEHLHAALELINRADLERAQMKAKLRRVEVLMAKLGEILTSVRAEIGLEVTRLVSLNRIGRGASLEAEDLRDALDVQWRSMLPMDQASVRSELSRLIGQFDRAGHDPGDEDR